jgi:hypothetical protein
MALSEDDRVWRIDRRGLGDGHIQTIKAGMAEVLWSNGLLLTHPVDELMAADAPEFGAPEAALAWMENPDSWLAEYCARTPNDRDDA